MPVVVAHFHQWTQVTGGLLCTITPCTAFLSLAVLQANIETSSGVTKRFSGDIWNSAWKRSGGN